MQIPSLRFEHILSTRKAITSCFACFQHQVSIFIGESDIFHIWIQAVIKIVFICVVNIINVTFETPKLKAKADILGWLSPSFEPWKLHFVFRGHKFGVLPCKSIRVRPENAFSRENAFSSTRKIRPENASGKVTYSKKCNVVQYRYNKTKPMCIFWYFISISTQNFNVIVTLDRN